MINEIIKKDRTKRKMTQTQYGNLFCVCEATVRNWESGRKKPHNYVLMLMSFDTELLQLAHKKMTRNTLVENNDRKRRVEG